MQKKVIDDFFVEISMNLSLFKAKIMVFFMLDFYCKITIIFFQIVEISMFLTKLFEK